MDLTVFSALPTGPRLSVEGAERQFSDGTSGNDRLAGTAESDFIDGLAGNDRILGRGGDDSLTGGLGDDVLRGGQGNDSLEGGGFPGNGQDDDRLFGGAGDDFLYGGVGDDVMVGGTGGDYFNPGEGDDIMRGGRGRDLFVDIVGDGSDTLTGGAQRDSFNFLFTQGAPGAAEVDTVTDFAATQDSLVITLPGGDTTLSGGTARRYLNDEGIAWRLDANGAEITLDPNYTLVLQFDGATRGADFWNALDLVV